MRVVEAPASDFASWVQPHLTAMTRLAVRLAPADDRHAYEDIVQLALERAWRRRETFDAARGSEQAWLLAIVADQARRARTRRPRRVEHQPPAVVQPADPALELAVRELPRRQRMAVELHYYLGLPIRECAEVLGVAEGTVKSALSDARAKLRTLLEVHDD